MRGSDGQLPEPLSILEWRKDPSLLHHFGNHRARYTTTLYDRRQQQVTCGEVERIRYERKAQVPKEMSE